MNIGEITVDRTFDIERFAAALTEADDVGAVIRCHFEAEQAIDFVLNKLTDGRSDRVVKKWMFGQKVDVCHLLDIHQNWVSAFTLLNRQRNEFAHRGTSKITDQQVLDLFHITRQVFPSFGEEWRVQIEKIGYDKVYRDVCAKERYVWCVFTIVSGFLALPQIQS